MTADWAERLRLAMRVGVPPEAFWRLSLAEWRALTEPGVPATLGRSELARLMADHPDEGADEGAR